jgi:hypothetical protein
MELKKGQNHIILIYRECSMGVVHILAAKPMVLISGAKNGVP